MFKTRYLSCFIALLLSTSPLFSEETTPAAAKTPAQVAKNAAKNTEKHETTSPSSMTAETATAPANPNELPMDEETKAAMIEVQKLQLEVTKLELLQKKNLLDLQMAHDKLVLENEMQQAEESKLQAKLNAAKSRLELENALRAEQQKQLNQQLSAEHEKQTLLNTLQEAQNKQQELKMTTEVLKFNNSVLDLKLQKEKLELQLALNEKKIAWDEQAMGEPEYLRDPFENGKLVITDRRVELNGFILRGTAQRVIEQIEFFNNKSTEYPIFLVIDRCYGGSVMEGLQIVRAIRSSRSPVYVVVKSFAASMAAVITTLAPRSFALPDATILHHQVMAIAFGNRTEQREQLEVLEQWTQRTLRPVAEKMGLSLDEFVKQMYVHNSTGDWAEFADTAVKVKWVDQVVTDIRETGYRSKANSKSSDKDSDEEDKTEEKVDAQGKRYVQLPPLPPLDVYHLYNPDNRFRQ